MQATKSKKFTKEEWSWIMYEWADSAFATIMLATLFPVFFVSMAGGEGSLGSAWWGWGNSAARIIVGICAPLIGALAAYKGYKKRMFVLFMSFGILFHMFLAAQGSWQMLLIGYIFAYMCWCASSFVYDAYLPDVTTKDRMDKVSAWSKAMGYIGGGTIPFTISIILVLFGENFGIDNELAVRISIVMTAVWWGIFSIPMIKDVKHKYGVAVPPTGMMTDSLKKIWQTAKKIRKNKGLFTFIIAYFFYIDGVSSVIIMATAYGTELGLGAQGMMGALFVTQIVAVPCSMLFGRLAGKYNPVNLIAISICIYITICLTAFFMGFGLEEGWFGMNVAVFMFWALAIMVGTVQGGIQAISRSTFGRLVPPENSGEYFGFFEIFGRFAAVLGPFLYATILAVTGRPSVSILSIIGIFLAGLIMLLRSRRHLSLERG